MAWISGRSVVMNQWFERIFSPPWMHVVMHAGLYVVLAVMGVTLARQFWQAAVFQPVGRGADRDPPGGDPDRAGW